MTLDKIKVDNFQSIACGEVDLGRFTVFTGPSSSGKSAFVRAANAVIRNSFNPSQVTFGKKVSEVTVFVDGHEVKAVRGKSKSTYILDGEEYTKAGRSVPDPILSILSMPEIAGMETSFTSQFDKPYLLSEPGAVASKVLGSLTNVSVLHDSLRESNRRNREIGSRIKVKNEDLDSMEVKLTEFGTIEELISIVEESSNIVNFTETAVHTAKNLSRAVDSTEELLASLTASEATLSNASEVNALTTESIEALMRDLEGLDRCLLVEHSIASLPDWDFAEALNIESLPDVSAVYNLTRLLNILDGLNPVDVSYMAWVSSTSTDSIQNLTTKTQELASYITKFTNLVAELEENSSTLSGAAASIAKVTAEYDTLFSGMEVCPLCDSPLHD